jgi:hypothetical protein
MSNTPTPNDLGNIIGSATVRKVIYAVYVVALLITGACQVAYAAGDLGQPQWLTITLAVLAYLGVPIGGIAAANTTAVPKHRA